MDKLDELLGIANGVVASTPSPTTPAIPRTQTEDEDNDDFKYSRENLYHIIERGQDAIDGILEVAKQSDHPRSYVVAGNLISQVAEVTEKLSRLQSSMKRLKEVPNNAPKNVTNALYVGSTAELQKLLKGDKGK